MTKLLKILTYLVLLFLCTIEAHAQGNSNGNGNGNGNGYAFGLGVNIPQISIIALRSNSSTSISLGLDGPAEAGLGATNTKDSSIWVHYTFVKGKNTRPKAKVYAKISSGSVPSGMTLNVEAKSPTSHGKGNKGTSTGEITLTSTDQAIIENIKSANTGKGANKGHNLVYDLDLSSYNIVNYTAPVVLTITYTIAE
jgi:hypothetical protein